jgi:threonine/homoserine/homoserine lactone efflux protein
MTARSPASIGAGMIMSKQPSHPAELIQQLLRHLRTMTDTLSFILAALALSATPGSANALLFASGASVDMRRCLTLVQAGVLGYTTAILVLLVILGPALAANPSLKLVLQIACVGNMLLSARGLWVRDALEAGSISARTLFGITLCNPKAFIFAFTLLPSDPSVGLLAKLPWLLLLLVVIGVVELGWATLGNAVRKGLLGPISVPFCCRAGAVVIAGLAVPLTGSVISSGLALAGLHH